MNKEYIEREEISRFANKIKGDFAPLHRLVIDALVYGIDNYIPAADVTVVRHGKWKLHDNGDGTCDQCHHRQTHIWDFDNWQNYCGVCGAKMDG